MSEEEKTGEKASEEKFEEVIVVNVEDERVIKSHVYWAVAGGLIPIPIIDIATVTAIQYDMIQQLCQNHSLSYSQQQVKTFASALAAGTLARVFASAVKSIPGLGTLIGGASMPIMAGASTYAVGRVFSRHFQDGGTMDNFRSESFKDFYDSQINAGRKIAEDLRKKFKASFSGPDGGSTDFSNKEKSSQLEELERMFKNGEISEELFQKLKSKLF